ncbi:MAG: TetR family transcriptional regulator [Nocardiopsaceae bacterium]|nr:TetR family transcriptional regulator [Nocardiopsaceae bacterium]
MGEHPERAGAGDADRPRGGPRSAGTRAAILAAARTHFSTVGYERTTIRGIAASAGIDPAMVIRYYSSKAGLFAAAADLDLSMPDLTQVAPEQMGALLVKHFIGLWESDLADTVLALMLRSATADNTAAERMRQTFASQVVRPIAAALGSADAERRAGLIGSQLIGMALCRYVLQLEPIASAETQDVIADLSPTVQRYLTEPLPSAAAAAETPADQPEGGE